MTPNDDMAIIRIAKVLASVGRAATHIYILSHPVERGLQKLPADAKACSPNRKSVPAGSIIKIHDTSDMSTCSTLFQSMLALTSPSRQMPWSTTYQQTCHTPKATSLVCGKHRLIRRTDVLVQKVTDSTTKADSTDSGKVCCSHRRPLLAK